MSRRLCSAFAAGMLAACVSVSMASSAGTPASGGATQMQNFAFARCVAIGFDDNAVVRADAGVASKAYVALNKASNDSDAAWRGIDELAKQWLNLPYQGFHTGNKLKLLPCIDFQQSSDRSILPTDYPVPNYDAATQLRHFALAHCFANVFDDKAVGEDAGAATTAYIEFGKNGIEDYTRMGSLVRQWLNRPDQNLSGTRSQIMKCMDIYHGTELREAVKFYAGLAR